LYWQHPVAPTPTTHQKVEVVQGDQHVVDLWYRKPEHIRKIQDDQERKHRGNR
jgi:hypothetical protein